MRLTCPNCGAQYEVPDEVIPVEGRDVQCSNCGDTWFQPHPTAEEPEDDSSTIPAEPEPSSPEPEPAPDPVAEPEYEPEPEPELQAEAQAQRQLDASVSDILKEEARREAELRARESDPLESQPDLGLEAASADEPERRAREAKDRMARMRGEEPVAESAEASSRRGLLPDIEEINSTLRSSSDTAAPTPAPTQAGPAKRKKSGGFMRGFVVVLVFGAILALIYTNANSIAKSVPQSDPMLSAYVALVDQARLWLDTQISGISAE